MPSRAEKALAVVCGTAPPRERFLLRDIGALRGRGWNVRCFGLDGSVWPVEGAAGACGVAAAGGASGFCGVLPCLLRHVAGRPLPFRSRLAVLRRVKLILAIADFVRDGGLVLAEFAWLTADVAEEAARAAGRPWCCFVHAWDVFTRPEAELAARLRGASAVAACSESAAAAAGKAIRREVPVIHHGLDFAEWEFQSDRPGGLLVCAVGRLEPKKGFDRLLAAWPAILRRFPEARLAIAGEGSERCLLETQATVLGLAGGQVEFLGALDERGVRNLLAESSMLVLPSRRMPDGDRDGIANVLVEAMALGTVTITTAAGAADEIVEDNVTGILLPAEAREADVAEAVIALAADRRRWGEMVRSARDFVESHFDIRNTAASLSAWLEEAVH